ncbi:C40 family peptidase [Mucilaginibacter ginsenosidivorans]|uniref:NlpC/P60 family protein n=1 Tax=Mucilaginibacter ginsenosidivorans TaxID=398053 RepID=A0A5B8URK8_9SPHI|nr:C40 family peptidase [Mucilaginibacter ginsenosidivorans]QEC61488.1 NlpC/P60 family protein [Mucilaginibacter ginsenosidivorans]
MKRYLTLTVLLFLCVAFAATAHSRKMRHSYKVRVKPPVFHLNGATDTISSYDLMYFAQSLIGIPYREASSDPLRGFDCSGFVSYVFKSFNADVPRSSGDYANIGREISIEDARQGDIILFKGTKSYHPHSIGHVAIVYSNEGGKLTFIHSTSGKENGVTITAMEGTYKRRFVKVVRLLRQNDIFQAQAN